MRLAERLNRLAPGAWPKKTMFLTSGAEAVENAVKIARYRTKRSAVIAFSGGFHGRTLMTMALTGKVDAVQEGLRAVSGRDLSLPNFLNRYPRHRPPSRRSPTWIAFSRRRGSEVASPPS